MLIEERKPHFSSSTFYSSQLLSCVPALVSFELHNQPVKHTMGAQAEKKSIRKLTDDELLVHSSTFLPEAKIKLINLYAFVFP